MEEMEVKTIVDIWKYNPLRRVYLEYKNLVFFMYTQFDLPNKYESWLLSIEDYPPYCGDGCVHVMTFAYVVYGAIIAFFILDCKLEHFGRISDRYSMGKKNSTKIVSGCNMWVSIFNCLIVTFSCSAFVSYIKYISLKNS